MISHLSKRASTKYVHVTSEIHILVTSEINYINSASIIKHICSQNAIISRKNVLAKIGLSSYVIQAKNIHVACYRSSSNGME